MTKLGAAQHFESVFIAFAFRQLWRTAAHAYAHHNHKEKVFGE